MIYVSLRKKICELLKSKSTLLWLEGAKYEKVNRVQMKGENIVLSLANGTIKLIHFEKYTLTAVGVQFWCQGHPGVLYKWDFPENTGLTSMGLNVSSMGSLPDDDPPSPPNLAA